MGTVIDMVPVGADGWMQGPVRCLQCGHEWRGVAPVGTIGLECPKCSLLRGCFMHTPSYTSEDHYQCACGSQVFCLTKKRVYCPNCGRNHKPWD